MKKIVIKSFIASIIITLLGAIINFCSANYFDKILIGYTMYGGEISERTGFGISLSKVYPMIFGEENVMSTDYVLSFNDINFVMSLIVSFLISFIIIFVLTKVFINKKK